MPMSKVHLLSSAGTQEKGVVVVVKFEVTPAVYLVILAQQVPTVVQVSAAELKVQGEAKPAPVL